MKASTEYDKTPVQNKDSSNPSIVYDPYYEDVVELEITISDTDQKSFPFKLQLGIFGCAHPIPIVITPPVEPSTQFTSTSMTSLPIQTTAIVPTGKIINVLQKLNKQ